MTLDRVLYIFPTVVAVMGRCLGGVVNMSFEAPFFDRDPQTVSDAFGQVFGLVVAAQQSAAEVEWNGDDQIEVSVALFGAERFAQERS